MELVALSPCPPGQQKSELCNRTINREHFISEITLWNKSLESAMQGAIKNDLAIMDIKVLVAQNRIKSAYN